MQSVLNIPKYDASAMKQSGKMESTTILNLKEPMQLDGMKSAGGIELEST